jgi:hypothetical protein
MKEAIHNIPRQNERFARRESRDKNFNWIQNEGVSLLYAGREVELKALCELLREHKNVPGIKTCLSPGRVMNKIDFCLTFPPRSIAGDGSVLGESWLEGLYANFDHHVSKEGEQGRLGKSAFCEWVLTSLRKGTLDRFRVDGKLNVFVFLNHLDGDNALALATLMLYDTLSPEQLKLLRKLTWLEGRMDAHAALFCSCADDDAKALKGWILPITEARMKYGWLLERMTCAQKSELIQKIVDNTLEFVSGKQTLVELDERFELLEDFGYWRMVQEKGADARRGIAKEYGLAPFISYRNQAEGGGHLYSVANLNEDPSFPMARLFRDLNFLEKLTPENIHGNLVEVLNFTREGFSVPESEKVWGGDPVGGSFNNGGSRFSPEDLSKIINNLLNGYRKNKFLLTAINYARKYVKQVLEKK